MAKNLVGFGFHFPSPPSALRIQRDEGGEGMERFERTYLIEPIMILLHYFFMGFGSIITIPNYKGKIVE